MANPLVSVILCVKNGERFLREALESVVAQTYCPLEIWVIDGHSTDDSLKIARSFPEVRIVMQTDDGLSNAFNAGIAAATGEFVAVIASDDRWLPEKIALQVAFMQEHPEIDLSITRFRFFLEPGYPIPTGFKSSLLEGDHTGQIMETLLVRRTVFALVGGFDPAYTAGDVDWFARVKDKGMTMALIPQVMLHKRIHDSNLSSNTAVNNQELLRILRRSVVRQRTGETD